MQTKTEPSKAVRVVSTVLGTLLLLGVVVGCAAWLLGGPSDPKTNQDSLDKQTAVVMCQKFIEDRLKSPGSAKFSGVTDTKIEGSHWNYNINGWVDSENSFGALVRNNYVCAISSGDGTEWTLDELKLQEH